jgi:hypothetical protein
VGAIHDRELEHRVISRRQQVVRRTLASVLRHEDQLVVVIEGEVGLGTVLREDELPVGAASVELERDRLEASVSYGVERVP